jgi:hypothetical protein
MKILGHWHCATETIEAVSDGFRGGYRCGVRFCGGRHTNTVVRCRTERNAIRLFDEAVAARKQHARLWWLDVA